MTKETLHALLASINKETTISVSIFDEVYGSARQDERVNLLADRYGLTVTKKNLQYIFNKA